ncbi:AmmeMemoRadiSam system radical SAM enzyme [Planctomycetota bacterium]
MDVQCELCPKYCVIGPGESGECRVRINREGRLRSVVYGFPTAIHRDPIEKKPLNHFLPGTEILSLATVGCNLHCLNCQNWQISQANPEDSTAMACSPQRLVDMTVEAKLPSIAYTYTDPVVYYEYTLDTAKLARAAGLRNVLVTAAYVNPRPWQQLLPFIDAANIDLKSISDRFYREVCSGSLKPVQEAIVAAKAAGVWVEITHLVIPTLNDNPSEILELVQWIRRYVGSATPLHFSAFYPQHKMQNLPVTPLDTLERARRIALAQGLKHVYIGNVMSEQGQHTRCGRCAGLLIERSSYRILSNRMVQGTCPDCGNQTEGVWQ